MFSTGRVSIPAKPRTAVAVTLPSLRTLAVLAVVAIVLAFVGWVLYVNGVAAGAGVSIPEAVARVVAETPEPATVQIIPVGVETPQVPVEPSAGRFCTTGPNAVCVNLAVDPATGLPIAGNK